VAINVKTGMPPFGILANHKIKMCHNSMKKIMIQKILLRTIGISEQSTLLCEQKNCYPVVRFSATPYRLVPSQKALPIDKKEKKKRKFISKA